MSTFVKFAFATALVTATAGLANAQQGRSIEVIPAATQNFAAQQPAQTFAQAPEAPVEAPAVEQAPEPQAAPAPQIVQVPRAQVLPPRVDIVRPVHVPAPRHVEKCHDDKPVYGHYAPRYQAPTYHAPRYQEPRYDRYSYAPQHNGYGYRRGY